MYGLYLIGFVVACVISLLLTPLVKRFAFRVGAVDAPNERKVHSRIMPRLGGLAIFLAFVGAYFVISPVLNSYNPEAGLALLLGGGVVVLTGALDDRFQISPRYKLLGQLIAAIIVVSFGLVIDLSSLPFIGDWLAGKDWISIPITIIWIIGVSNAINLIDGLDGLSAGVSGIATSTILVLAIILPSSTGVTVALLSVILLGSIVGFLFYNIHPAKIFMGDSGSLFLGFALATLSILGFKQATVVSLLIPILILGVPLSDTAFAILRRIVNKTPISAPDKSHLHHCFLQLGFSHRVTVWIIYGISCVFALSAIVCSILLAQSTRWGTAVIVALLLAVIVLGAEAIGLISKNRKPVLHALRRLFFKQVSKPDQVTKSN
ncbi:glycosyltransferase family 4 protein [Paenibacillus sp. KN14-4R]|uniref:glycosyltransferase family 4 protein n=1 Tax=Paenibacillus sp. KN14-4R TaxID=3445773 RepID=UPI003FA0DD95